MAINNVDEVLHRIRVKLYPSYLPGMNGQYIARTDNEATLSIEQVCAALKNRGGFAGNYETLVDNVRRFLDEAAYQLCNGFAVNMKYFSIHPNVGGTFSSANDTQNHPVTFHFRATRAMRSLVRHIAVDIEGLADTAGWIDEFTDTEENSVNALYAAGDIFTIRGSKIKIVGDNPGNGVYFVPVEAPAEAVKATRIAENTSTKILGIQGIIVRYDLG